MEDSIFLPKITPDLENAMHRVLFFFVYFCFVLIFCFFFFVFFFCFFCVFFLCFCVFVFLCFCVFFFVFCSSFCFFFFVFFEKNRIVVKEMFERSFLNFDYFYLFFFLNKIKTVFRSKSKNSNYSKRDDETSFLFFC